MHRTISISSLLGLALAPLALPAQPSITVTLYDLAGLRNEVRETMKKEAARILRDAGLDLEWVDCEFAGKYMNLAECAKALGPTRLMLQLVPGFNKLAPKASGLAVVQDSGSVFACLYPERLKLLARDANWEFGDLLGHAAAHELGHLLLQSSAHAPAGVMRAQWETEDLRKLAHRGLVFLAGQLSGVPARVLEGQ